MFTQIIKRDGRVERFKPEKITWAIFKAAMACGGNDFKRAEDLCKQVVELAEKAFGDKSPDVEFI